MPPTALGAFLDLKGSAAWLICHHGRKNVYNAHSPRAIEYFCPPVLESRKDQPGYCGTKIVSRIDGGSNLTGALLKPGLNSKLNHSGVSSAQVRAI